MRNSDEFDLENTDIDNVPRFHAMKQHVTEQFVFFELAFSESGCEMRAVNRNVELFQEIRKRTEVIFVTVSEDYRSDIVAVLVQKVEIRDRNVDSIRGFFRKSHSGVENQHLVAETNSHAIHSKLADAAEWYDLED